MLFIVNNIFCFVIIYSWHQSLVSHWFHGPPENKLLEEVGMQTPHLKKIKTDCGHFMEEEGAVSVTLTVGATAIQSSQNV